MRSAEVVRYSHANPLEPRRITARQLIFKGEYCIAKIHMSPFLGG
jgi:hypothetical protein